MCRTDKDADETDEPAAGHSTSVISMGSIGETCRPQCSFAALVRRRSVSFVRSTSIENEVRRAIVVPMREERTTRKRLEPKLLGVSTSATVDRRHQRNVERLLRDACIRGNRRVV